MKSRLLGLLAATALSVVAGQTAQAQEILLGNLFAGAGPFATLAKTNEIAAQMAVEEVNAAGGVGGKKLKIVSFDTAGKPEQAVVGVRKLAEDDKVMAIIGPFSSGECRVAFPAGERTGVVMMSMASSAPKLAEPFTYGLRNTSDEGYMFRNVMKTLQEKKYPIATGGDRLRHRRRHLQDHGRDRAAEHHEGGRHRDEGGGHVPDPGVRSCGPGVGAEGDADRPDRRRLGTRCRGPFGAGAAAARPQGTAGGRLHHRRFRTRDPHGRERQRHRDPDDVLRRRQRQGEEVRGRVRQARQGRRPRADRRLAVRRRRLRHRAVLCARDEGRQSHRRSGQARGRAHQGPRYPALDAAVPGARRADLVRQERRRAQARLHHRDAGRKMEPDRRRTPRGRDGCAGQPGQ